MKRVFIFSADHLSEDGQLAAQSIRAKFTHVKNPHDAEAVLVLGGDGTMLKAIRVFHKFTVPFIGVNYGHLGFLMNPSGEQTIEEIVQGSLDAVSVHLLGASVFGQSDTFIAKIFAFNDMYMERSGIDTAHIRVGINTNTLFDPLVADGIIVSTAAGSTAYNAAAGGQIVPINVPLMCLTAVSPALFHNWRSALRSIDDQITLSSQDIQKRPVRFLADGILIPDVAKAVIYTADKCVTLKFVHSHDFHEKVLRYQFGKA